MYKQIVVFVAIFAMVATMVLANEYQQHYEHEEKKFIQIPALKLKLGMDKLHIKLPNLMSIFQQHQEQRYPSY